MKLRMIGVLIACIALAGCTNPLAQKDDFQTVVKSHGEALAKSMAPESFEQFSGNSHFDGGITAKGQRESLKLALTADSKEHEGNSSLTLGFDGNITSSTQSGINLKWSLEAILASWTGYVNIRTLQVTGVNDSDMMAGMVNGMMKEYGGKWIRLPGGNQKGMPAQPNIGAAKSAFANHPVFAMKKDLWFNDGAYHYEVTLDKAQLLELHKDLKKALTGTWMDDEEIANTKRDIDGMDLTGVLTVENDNRAYGSFSGAFSRKDSDAFAASNTGASQGGTTTGSISYSNSSDAFHLEIASGTKFTVDIKKELTKVSGTVAFKDQHDRGAPINFSIEKTLNGYNVSASTDMDIPTGEKINLAGEGKLEIKKDDNVKIEAPAQSIDLETIMGGTGMVPPGFDGSDASTGGSLDPETDLPLPPPSDAELNKLRNEAEKLERDANLQIEIR